MPGADEVVVFEVRRQDSRCDGCAEGLGSGRWIRLVGEGEARRGLCMKCAGLAELVLLPTGDAALTRRAKARSARYAVLVRWARARKRYERQGLLLEEPAIQLAMEELRAEGRPPRLELHGDVWVRAR